ncbi:hypothetical protein [Leptospira santarosai]|uniref:Lipoprotein n=1 Tax=Leptospira santarosai TaxID=28183 RepID=A0AB73M514_9LEPT|nr:hypothetical protein [Leptospira santarosai]ONF90890.1 hypothetical protein BWD14_19135 [Leptospira santarosai]
MKTKIVFIKFFLSIMLVLTTSSCEDSNKSGFNKEGFLAIWFESLLSSPSNYDSACDNDALSTSLIVSTPVTENGLGKYYRFTTGASGFKYKFTLSADYPNCGARITIKNCQKPNAFAYDSNVTCNSGTYENYVSGGSQTCQIPSFANQRVLVFLSALTIQYPNTPCATVQFEVLP